MASNRSVRLGMIMDEDMLAASHTRFVLAYGRTVSFVWFVELKR